MRRSARRQSRCPSRRVRPLANLALAGDWIGSLPATIESAVMAGEHAASILRHAPAAALPFHATRPLKTEDAA